MVRAPCCDKVGLKKGPWTTQEDQILTAYVLQHGHGNWRALPKQAGTPPKPICYFSHVSISLLPSSEEGKHPIFSVNIALFVVA